MITNTWRERRDRRLGSVERPQWSLARDGQRWTLTNVITGYVEVFEARTRWTACAIADERITKLEA